MRICDSVLGSTTKSYSYDSAGRTTSVTTGAGTTTLAYDYEGRITTITYPDSSTNTFGYNGLDTRVGKVDSTGTKTYKRDGAYVTDPVLSDSAASYTPGISERRSSTTKFYHTDRLGTTERLTNTSQTTTDTHEYDAFGLLVSSSGSTPTPFGFAGAWGYQEDPDSGLKLLGHRYYDPSTGRFLTRDPAYDGRNWFAYCDNGPATGVDVDGRNILKLFKVLFEVSKRVRKAPISLQNARNIRMNGGNIEIVTDNLSRGKEWPRNWVMRYITPQIPLKIRATRELAMADMDRAIVEKDTPSLLCFRRPSYSLILLLSGPPLMGPVARRKRRRTLGQEEPTGQSALLREMAL
jgi:RHS repeat-associated protein